MKKASEQLKAALDSIATLNMERALRCVRDVKDKEAFARYADEVERIEEDYRLMVDYINLGYNDPERDNVYLKLLQRLYRTVSNMRMACLISNCPPFAEASRRAEYCPADSEKIRSMLENYVTDVALLGLESPETRRSKARAIYSRHNEVMQALFSRIMISVQWSENEALFMEDILLSPVVDTVDARLIVSAVMLAAMNSFDPRKFSVMMNVYLKTTDEHLRQRALVGWVLSLIGFSGDAELGFVLFPECDIMLRKACSDERTAREIADLQKQIMFCMDAEKDHDRIQKDIMPTLLKSNNFNITRFGITEKEEDPMQDVFDPGASEHTMEAMEASFRKMIDMQKEGSDIYFGGFSQMKRFTFFSSIANWFYPFFTEHADISYTTDKLDNSRFMQILLDNGPFCDSDKYSFVLAMSSVIDKLPENMREMLGSGDALGHTVSDIDKENPAYIRRMYLQDLFRFFRLYPQRDCLVKAFSAPSHIFVAGVVFRHEGLDRYMAELASFMLKRRDYDSLSVLVNGYHNDDDVKWLLVEGMYYLETARPDVAMDRFDRILELQPDNERATAMLAKACLVQGEAEEAEMHYEKLCMLNPDNIGYALNYCVALTETEKYDEAVTMLYKLNYEHPESLETVRVLAWGLMGQGRLEQAEKEYERLLGSDKVTGNDYLNAGYCKWFRGELSAAAVLFRKYKETEIVTTQQNGDPLTIENVFLNDWIMLERNGITPVSYRLMVSLVDAVEKDDDDEQPM
ncbi:tetratricopeptide repeat protein [Prevotella sp. PCHR]|uniref:Tetratricopeptide repeat protein n=1 Tax=Xylanibacter caecicola TaxID=2736294 RepID=A0ABX2B3G0_9BACT|nr:tetratricopeptide repeat protein [Xylanibacter caecicola]NPE26056.1 tetratricopeptide repeat protein [Xylanibacter caecicola]